VTGRLVATGWAELGDVYMTVEPLRDADTGGYAHLTYREALAAVAALGAELPTMAQLQRLHEEGLELQPVTLPDVVMVRATGCVAERDSDEFQAAAQRLRETYMAGPEWARIHDARVDAQLRARGWDGRELVANAGKHWLRGAPPGRAYLGGWWSAGRFIQAGVCTGLGPHGDGHHDYGTTTLAVRLEAP
jgi:hypothetical protein